MSVNGNGDAPHPAARPRQPRRTNVPNLSPTRPPQEPADQDFWPNWSNVPVELLDWDMFDADGFPILGGPR
jgi:hypothetical protein